MSSSPSCSPSPPASLTLDVSPREDTGPISPAIHKKETVDLAAKICPQPAKSPNSVKTKTSMSTGFSIQSILARPEPVRPVPEHVFPYAGSHFLHYSNLAAAFFPHKILSAAGHVPGIYGSSCWQSQIPSTNNELPGTENLSTKSSLSGCRPSVKLDSMNAEKRHEKDLTGTTPSSHHTASAGLLQASRKLLSSHTARVETANTMQSLQMNTDENSHSPSPFSTDGNDDLRDGKSPPSSPSGSNGHRRKKTRTVFSRSQVFQLESTFDLKRYLSSADRAALAASLNLSEQQIKIWFQNRRNKWKRQISSDTDSAIISAGQMHAAAAAGRFAPSHGGFPISLYPFPGNMGVSPGGDSTGNSGMASLFCPGPMHPMYMSSHLPFSRSSV